MTQNSSVSAEITGIQNSVNAMNSAGEALNNIQNAITTAVTSSDGFWKSTGAKAFRDAMVNEFRSAFAGMVNDLAAIEHALNANNQQYNATIDTERAQANQFLGLLNH